MASVPDCAIAWPILISVFVRPSMLFQPAAHFDTSILKPSGPVIVLPSADKPHLLSLMRLTTASRWLFQRASHSAIEAGAFPATVVAVLAAVVAAPAVVAVVPAVVAVVPAVVVAVAPPPPLLLPQAAIVS